MFPFDLLCAYVSLKLLVEVPNVFAFSSSSMCGLSMVELALIYIPGNMVKWAVEGGHT
jgi:hypothetical protein